MKDPQINLEVNPVFSEERYDYFRKSGLTEEEIRILEGAQSAGDGIELLPDTEKGLQSVFDKIEALPENGSAALDELHKMAEKDPQSFAQIFALVTAADMAHEDDSLEQ